MKDSHDIFPFFKTNNLVNVDAIDFEQNLKNRIGKIDHIAEGYTESELEEQVNLRI
jgi:hypothetical protein